MWSPMVAKHSLPPGYGKRPEFERLPNPLLTSEPNTTATHRTMNFQNARNNYALVTENMPPYEEPPTESTGIESESASVKSPVFRNISDSENSRSKYNDWGLCAEYLKTFSGLTPHDDGIVLLGATVEFPEDFKMLPIVTISDIKYPSWIQEYIKISYIEESKFSGFNSALPELPAELKTLFLYSFKGTLPPLPTGLHTLRLDSFKGALPPLPAGLRDLHLGSFNDTLPPLPAGLQWLYLLSFKGDLPNPLPAGLQTLKLFSFIRALPSLPAGLRHLYLYDFKRTLPDLPSGLQELYLVTFNGTLPDPLPADLKTLELRDFIGTLPNPLPAGLESLYLQEFNGTLPNPLPAGLETLHLGSFTGTLPALPASLKKNEIYAPHARRLYARR
jgi:hypothetical protein